MGWERLGLGLLLLAIVAVGVWISWDAAQPTLFYIQGLQRTSKTYTVLFDYSKYALPISALLGIALGSLESHLKTRAQLRIKHGKIERHRATGTYVEHWYHAMGFVIAAISGLLLGTKTILSDVIYRRYAASPCSGFLLNLHFIGVILMTFSIAYYLADHLLSGGWEFPWPGGGLSEVVAEYRALFGGAEPPASGKWMASQKIAHLIWALVVGVIGFSGLVKVWKYFSEVPQGLLQVCNTLHDLFAVLGIIMLAVHMFFSFLPATFPLLKSLFTGYVPEDYAKRYLPEWLEGIKKLEEVERE